MKRTIFFLSNQTISNTFLSCLPSKDQMTPFSIYLHSRDRNNTPVNLCFWRDLFHLKLSLTNGECSFSPTVPFWKGSTLIAGNTLVITSHINYDQLVGKISAITKFLDHFFYATGKAILLVIGENQYLYQPVVVTAPTFD